MNVLLISNHLNTGGISSYLLNLGKELVRLGHQVTIVSGGGSCVELVKDLGMTHITMDIKVKSEAHPKLWLAIPRLARLVKETGIDLIHANTRVTQVMAASVSRITGKPFVSTCHGFFRVRLFRRLFPCWGKAVIAISGPVRDHLVDDFELDAKRVHLIPNGIDTAQFSAITQKDQEMRRRQWHVEGSPIIGIIARLSDVKGINVLIDAFPTVLSEFPQCRLWIVGDGPERGRLCEMVEKRGLEARVRFESIVNRTADILPIFDIFVMPSLQEGLGLSVIEAQAAGIPVVVSHVGGLPDLVENGKTGTLVPAGHSEKLALAIIATLRNPSKARQMADEARRIAIKDFALERMTLETVRLYEQVKSL